MVEAELKKIHDEPIKREYSSGVIINPDVYNKVVMINQIISHQAAIKFQYLEDNKMTLVIKPELITENGRKVLVGYCALKNATRKFELNQMVNLNEIKKPSLGSIKKQISPTDPYKRMQNFNQFNEVINKIIKAGKPIIIYYEKSTGEKSKRTLSNVSKPTEEYFYESIGKTKEQYYEEMGSFIDTNNYIAGYCHLKEYRGRTFKIERINKLIVLNL